MNATQAKAQAASNIANLEGTTTHATIRAARPAGLKTGANFTGQYLYDRFVGDSKEQQTYMDIVRKMAAAVELPDFKTIIGDMVKVAKGHLDAAIKADKDAGIYNEAKPSPTVAQCQARYKTAQNAQNIIRIGYGALRFAADHLEAAGYDEKTGYNAMRVIGLAALNAAKVKWDGTKAESPDVIRARRDQAAETRAMLKVQEAHPRNDNESRTAYFARIDKLVEQQMKADNEEQHTKRVNDLVAKIKALAGEDLSDVLDHLARAEQQEPAPNLH